MINPGSVGVFGTVGILNVGAGDTKLTFDKTDPAETIRAGRVVKDMIRRGYALLVEVEINGVKKFQRALDFDENTSEYIIADLDPVAAEKADKEEASDGLCEQTGQPAVGESVEASTTEASQAAGAPKRRGKRTVVDASKTRAVAVARSAGG